LAARPVHATGLARSALIVTKTLALVLASLECLVDHVMNVLLDTLDSHQLVAKVCNTESLITCLV